MPSGWIFYHFLTSPHTLLWHRVQNSCPNAALSSVQDGLVSLRHSCSTGGSGRGLAGSVPIWLGSWRPAGKPGDTSSLFRWQSRVYNLSCSNLFQSVLHLLPGARWCLCWSFLHPVEMQESVKTTTLPIYFPGLTGTISSCLIQVDQWCGCLNWCGILIDTATLITKRSLSSGDANNPARKSRILLGCLGLAIFLLVGVCPVYGWDLESILQALKFFPYYV